jgi:nucleotide-binding universal stress UspA family protein
VTEAVFGRIVVPTDFSACAREAWELARRLAGSMRAELVLVHVLVEAPLYSESPFARQRTREVYAAARRWAERELDAWAAPARDAGLTVHPVLRVGLAHREIVDLATDDKADLVVIGTHGRGGLARAMLGSVADRVARLAPCPVLLVREPR